MVITFDFHSKNVGSILTICNKLLTKTRNCKKKLHIPYYGNPRDFLTYDNGSVT